MKYVVKGVELKKGSFKNGRGEDVQYDNILLHCDIEDHNPKRVMLAGNPTDVLKVKNDFRSSVILNGAPVENFAELKGCEILPIFNRYGGLDYVQVISLDGKI